MIKWFTYTEVDKLVSDLKVQDMELGKSSIDS